MKKYVKKYKKKYEKKINIIQKSNNTFKKI